MNKNTKILASVIIMFGMTGLLTAAPAVDGVLSPSTEYDGGNTGVLSSEDAFGYIYSTYYSSGSAGLYILNDWCMADVLEETIAGDDISWSGTVLDTNATNEFRLFIYPDSSTTPTDPSFNPRIMLCRRPIGSSSDFDADILYDSDDPGSAVACLSFAAGSTTCTHSESSYGGSNHYHWELFMPKIYLAPLVANAGDDQIYCDDSPIVNVTLDGRGSTGYVDSWEWVNLSDPDTVISTTALCTIPVLNPSPASHTFRLTVTTCGHTSYEDVVVEIAEEADEFSLITERHMLSMYSFRLRAIYDPLIVTGPFIWEKVGPPDETIGNGPEIEVDFYPTCEDPQRSYRVTAADRCGNPVVSNEITVGGIGYMALSPGAAGPDETYCGDPAAVTLNGALPRQTDFYEWTDITNPSSPVVLPSSNGVCNVTRVASSTPYKFKLTVVTDICDMSHLESDEVLITVDGNPPSGETGFQYFERWCDGVDCVDYICGPGMSDDEGNGVEYQFSINEVEGSWQQSSCITAEFQWPDMSQTYGVRCKDSCGNMTQWWITTIE